VSGGSTIAGASLRSVLSRDVRLSISSPDEADFASGVTSASSSAATFASLLSSAMKFVASVILALFAFTT